MFLTAIRKCVCAGLLAGGALVLSSTFNLPYAAAQEAAAGNAGGRAHIDEVVKGLNRGRSVGQVAVSPDGKRLAWIQNGREGSEIRVASPGRSGQERAGDGGGQAGAALP